LKTQPMTLFSSRRDRSIRPCPASAAGLGGGGMRASELGRRAKLYQLTEAGRAQRARNNHLAPVRRRGFEDPAGAMKRSLRPAVAVRSIRRSTGDRRGDANPRPDRTRDGSQNRRTGRSASSAMSAISNEHVWTSGESEIAKCAWSIDEPDTT
jgi:hypothetical protein